MPGTRGSIVNVGTGYAIEPLVLTNQIYVKSAVYDQNKTTQKFSYENKKLVLSKNGVNYTLSSFGYNLYIFNKNVQEDTYLSTTVVIPWDASKATLP